METNEDQARGQSRAETCSLHSCFRQLARASALLLCLLSLHSYGATTVEPAPDNIETRMLACTPCHGLRGQGTQDDYFPRLAGKPAGYLYNQLAAFRDGRRHYSPMNYLLEYQNDAYLKAIAGYFASQDPPYLPRHAGTTDQRRAGPRPNAGNQGDASSRHPGLRRLSQPELHRHGARYSGSGRIAAQLHQRATRRLALRDSHGQAPDCMQLVAATSVGG